MYEHKLGVMPERNGLGIAKRGRRFLLKVCRHNVRFEGKLLGDSHQNSLVVRFWATELGQRGTQ